VILTDVATALPNFRPCLPTSIVIISLGIATLLGPMGLIHIVTSTTKACDLIRIPSVADGLHRGSLVTVVVSFRLGVRRRELIQQDPPSFTSLRTVV